MNVASCAPTPPGTTTSRTSPPASVAVRSSRPTTENVTGTVDDPLSRSSVTGADDVSVAGSNTHAPTVGSRDADGAWRAASNDARTWCGSAPRAPTRVARNVADPAATSREPVSTANDASAPGATSTVSAAPCRPADRETLIAATAWSLRNVPSTTNVPVSGDQRVVAEPSTAHSKQSTRSTTRETSGSPSARTA